MKKLFTLLFALVATTALWAHDFEVNGIYYNKLSDKTNEVEVTYRGSNCFEYSNEYTGSVTIPSSVTYNGTTYSVTSIGDGAFNSCESLTSVTIPNSVTTIGDHAFRYCYGLTLVTIPNSVTSIGGEAFSYCSGLTSITIPNSVTSIGDFAFHECSSLTSITIPNSVTYIGRYAFYNCSSLTSITIPNSVTSIGYYAFRSCSGLTSIIVEDANSTYDSRENCNAIIETATNTLIAGCQNTIIPNSVTSIGEGAFYDCTGLTSITIPNSVTSIGYSAFRSCSGLTSITIPDSVTSIGWDAFANTGIYNNESNWENSVLYISNCLIDAKGDISDAYIIKEGTRLIGGGAFFECSSLTSITIPNSVTSIGNDAFRGCSSLTSITIPNSVKSIGDRAFYNCSGLTFIESLAEVPPTTLGTKVFYNVSTTIPIYVPCGTVSAYQSSDWKDFTNIQEPLVEYSIAVGVNDSIMGTSMVDYNTYCEGAHITATANYRYRFVQWSDGNTDNPRVVVLTQDTTFTAEFAVSYSGQCGDNLYWAYDEANKTISITGSGDMYDYTKSTQPWLFFQEQITEVTTSNTTTSIGTSAFEGCIRLGKVSLGYGMGNIAANAFAECKRLYDIYLFASYPPFAEESSFANYNVYLYVPCENQRDYVLDVVWGEFKFIECIGAESDDTGGDDVTVTPGTNDVTITWPTEDDADTYSIVITKDGEVFCTLTFNSNGQLVSIAFAPGREGNHPAQYAEAAANGYRFTVTGLNEGTDYTYIVTSKDAANKTISEHSGEFTTQSTTALDNINSQSANVQKLIRDGQLLIIRDGKTYNAQGVELK